MPVWRKKYQVSGINRQAKSVVRSFDTYRRAEAYLDHLTEGQIACDGTLLKDKPPPRRNYIV